MRSQGIVKVSCIYHLGTMNVLMNLHGIPWSTVVVDILQRGPKWWTDWSTDRPALPSLEPCHCQCLFNSIVVLLFTVKSIHVKMKVIKKYLHLEIVIMLNLYRVADLQNSSNVFRGSYYKWLYNYSSQQSDFTSGLHLAQPSNPGSGWKHYYWISQTWSRNVELVWSSSGSAVHRDLNEVLTKLDFNRM